ncbi:MULTISPECIES: response regulator transcription factor [Nitrosomonas]|uniref:FixJ family two-component response regulator n=1 Tax=Nitrosomonas communis TaxID=44574 RepID=A0A0F7KD16_9PROT|nr:MULTISPECIES: response regulator [Nitrosomonas]AKH36582.1 LuxR family transcriptional regulator [Nitrosomonas communis]AKH39340.1 LuxR family transcriptional regulator [Nitrosomonas communis]TYP78379.1 FixJ family two-component response regulator [Nitrosomonas communis]UVS61565.1 response regulator [Nitrosomonas sp. PLL12]UVS61590.1 response regulator [Nitrosomonas sp. PLL12]
MISQHFIVFIVDDEPAVRDSLALLLKQEGIFVQTFENAETFLNAYQPGHKGCIILDVRMPGIGGLQLQEKLLNYKNIMPIIFLTGHGDIPMSVRAIKAGAIDFLTKPITRVKLLASVQSAFLESEKLIEANKHNQDALSRLASLTKREHEVMMIAIQGYHNKEIASRLGISFRTVEIHRSNIMHKTGAINLLDLARIAYESGLNTST